MKEDKSGDSTMDLSNVPSEPSQDTEEQRIGRRPWSRPSLQFYSLPKVTQQGSGPADDGSFRADDDADDDGAF